MTDVNQWAYRFTESARVFLEPSPQRTTLPCASYFKSMCFIEAEIPRDFGNSASLLSPRKSA